MDDVTVTTLIATYEQAKACLQTIEVTDSSHKAELNFLTETEFRHTLPVEVSPVLSSSLVVDTRRICSHSGPSSLHFGSRSSLLVSEVSFG